MADFPTRELLFGVTSIESYLDFSAQDLEFGFNETRRDRILRTYVRNVYHFHLNEIFSALKVSIRGILSFPWYVTEIPTKGAVCVENNLERFTRQMQTEVIRHL